MLFWKSKTFLAKLETSYGVDAVPTGAANAILASNVTLRPMEGEDVERANDKPNFGANPTIPVGIHAVLTFDLELVGSGTAGTPPAWGPLLRAMNVAETIDPGNSVTYNPITGIGESACLYFAIGTTRHVILGARGTAELKVSAQGIPMLSCTMTGLFTVPTTAAAPAVDYSAFADPQVATNANTPTFTIGGSDFVLRDLTLNLGNDVQRRFLIGQEAILIVDKAETLRAQVEAVSLDTYNPFAIANAGTRQEIKLVHGTAAGKIVTLDVPAAQQKRPSGYEQQQGIVEWPLDFTPLPTVANDQWTLTLT
ncbi:hypothetical protein D2V17_14205 [Aurantiacibacter xanthus]|uniref:Uncharacterized protein n=1 Tax=Aurantiacibacter xanthus TaxID=1784712 RepID=A0A3A1P6I9_9SPHN|nr:phage tail tube protein [Aurantiacibacter xanthus]RIV82951.1 hypothetical protein D2V17_14205 [Aurantiacibacter xanthus]